MMEKDVEKSIDNMDWLDQISDKLQPAILEIYDRAGEKGKKAKNVMHGTWLGHPFHSLLTDVPMGAWTVAAMLDMAELKGIKGYTKGADAAVGVGLAGAASAAIAGLTDWTGTQGKARKIGLLHGLLNITATGLYAASLILRKIKATRKAGIAISFLGYGATTAAGYLGGKLVFDQQTGVNHAFREDYPQEFVEVCDEEEVKEGELKCAKAGEIPLVIIRNKNKIYALSNICSHAGGPLCKGEMVGEESIQCPWHGSVFSFKDGKVINGPATEKQPGFETRIIDGKVYVRKQE